MANAAATLKEHSRLPRVVWRTLTDKALHCRSNTSSLWLRLTELYAETSSFGLIHVNSADTHIKIGCGQTILWQDQYVHTWEVYIKLVKHHVNNACCDRNKCHAKKDSITDYTTDHTKTPRAHTKNVSHWDKTYTSLKHTHISFRLNSKIICCCLIMVKSLASS